MSLLRSRVNDRSWRIADLVDRHVPTRWMGACASLSEFEKVRISPQASARLRTQTEGQQPDTTPPRLEMEGSVCPREGWRPFSASTRLRRPQSPSSACVQDFPLGRSALHVVRPSQALCSYVQRCRMWCRELVSLMISFSGNGHYFSGARRLARVSLGRIGR